MNTILAITAICLLPSDVVVEDRCDVIEVNHYHGDDGRLIHTQIIFWDYKEDFSGEKVAAWRLWKNPNTMPTRDQFTGQWQILWRDGDVMRMVNASSFRETWTQYDREMESRSELPQAKQRGLTQRPDAMTRR